jgi:hypothetical protein
MMPGQQPLPKHHQNKGVDYCLQEAEEEHTLIHVNGTAVERVSSVMFLGIHITENLLWTSNTTTIVKRVQQCLYFLSQLKKLGMPPLVLPKYYRCIIKSILSGSIMAWYGNCSIHDHKALQRAVKMAQYKTGAKFPPIQDILI